MAAMTTDRPSVADPEATGRSGPAKSAAYISRSASSDVRGLESEPLAAGFRCQ
jgi:hypothetical protein